MKCIDNPESVSTEAQPTKVAGTADQSSRHAPSCRPRLDIYGDSR